MVQLDVVLQEQVVRLTKMKKMKCPGFARRFTPECEAIMLSALDELQLNVEALVQSTPAADRTEFKMYAYDGVANHLHLLTRISSQEWRMSFARVWQEHVFAEPLSTRYEGPNMSIKDPALAAAKTRAHNAKCLDSGKLMAFMWTLGDSMLDFHHGDRTRHTMQKLVIWARLVAHLRPYFDRRP